MNITTNEILLMKKIKMNGDKNSATTTLEPTTDGASAEKGMRALMFQGMKNLMNNPELAQEAQIGDKIEPKTGNEDGKKYIAPYKSNLAFTSTPNFVKEGVHKYGAKFLGALMMISAGAVTMTTTTSCSPEKPEWVANQVVEMNLDFNQFFQAIQGFLTTLSAKLDKLDETNKLLKQMQASLIDIYTEVQNGNITMEEGFRKVFDQFMLVEANQDIFIQQLVENGMKQQEANDYIQQLIREVQQGNISAQQAWSQIIAKLDLTNSILQNIYNTLKESLSKVIELGEEANKTAKGILNNTATTNDKIDELGEKVTNVSAELINLRVANEAIGTNIKTAMYQNTYALGDKVASCISRLAESVHMDINQFKTTMVRMGISEQKLLKMSVSELLTAIDNNTAEVQNVGDKINNLYTAFQEHRLTAEQFAQQVVEMMTQMNVSLADIAEILRKINSNINALRNETRETADKIVKNQDRSYNAINLVVNNTNGLSDQLNSIESSMETFTTRLEKAVQENAISQNANVAACTAEIADIVRMSESDLKAFLTQIHISDQQLQKMSVSALIQAINTNTNEVKTINKTATTILNEYKSGKISAEVFAKKVLEILDKIDSKLGTLIAELKGARAEIVTEIDELTAITYQSGQVVTNKLDESKVFLGNKLDVIADGQGVIITTINEAVDKGIVSINANANANADKIAELIGMTSDDFRTLLVQMNISNQELQTMSVAQLLDAIKKNTAEIKNVRTTFENYVKLYESNQISAQEFAQKVINLLDGISGKLDLVLEELKNARFDIMTEFEKLVKNTSNINSNVQVISDKMNVIIEGEKAAAEKITDAVNQGTLTLFDNINANTDKIAEIIGMSSAEFKVLLTQMHISNQDLTKMSVSSLLSAINTNTSTLQGYKANFDVFVKQYQSNQITEQELLKKSAALLAEISSKFDGLSIQLTQGFGEVASALKTANTTLSKINNTTTINSSFLNTLNKDVADIKAAQKDYKQDFEDLKTLVKDNNVYQNEIVTEIKLQPEKYQAMFDKLNISVNQAIKMTSTELVAAIDKAIANYDTVEGKQTQLLTDIYNKLKTFENITFDDKNIIKAINDLKSSLNGDVTVVNAKLQAVIDALNEISAKIEALGNKMAQQHNDILAELKAANTTLTNINSTTTISSSFLNNLNKNVEDIKAAQKDYKQDFQDLKTYQSKILAEIKSHPEKYQAMADQLGITVNQAANMTASAFTAAVDKAIANYDATEGKQTQIMTDIYNELKNHQGEKFDDTNIINAINDLKGALNGDITTVNAKLQAVLDALKEISTKLDGISGQITKLYNDVMAALKEANTTLASLNGNSTITNAYLNKLNQNIEDVKAVQKDYKQDFADLKALAKDQITYQSQILSELQAHPAKYQDMLNKLGISVNQAINMSASQFTAAIDKAIANYDATEGKQTQLLTDIYGELKKHQGGSFDDTNVINAINSLKVSMNGDVTTVNAKLQAVLDALQGISDQIDDLIKEMKALNSTVTQMNTYVTKFDGYWTAALNKLGDYTTDLAEIKALIKSGNNNTAAINAKVTEIKQDLEALKAGQAKAEAYLSGIESKSQTIINKLDQFKNIDYDKLEASMKSLGDTYYNQYEALLKSLAIDPAKFDSVKELVQAIKESVVDIQNDTKYGKKIYDILKDVDWTKPDTSAKIDQVISILNNLKVTCKCSCSGGNPDEGGHGVDDLDDLING